MFFGFGFARACILPCDSPLCCNNSTRSCRCRFCRPYYINPCGWYA
ncbi:MAG TPA: hypothetical protein IAA90_00320 [Candidatus Ornithoclostridium excrementipullorum]|nr:hypothetical protein [Candidatus Ornithoclostridium excrementipullorum]